MSTLNGKTIVIDGVVYRLVAVEREDTREHTQNIFIFYVNGTALHLVFGKSREEWEQVYGADPDLWDVSFEELVDGTLDIDEDIWYWYIDGRCFETDEKVDKEGD